MNTWTRLIMLAGAAVLAGPARALPLAYEGFNYAVGQTLPTMTGGSGWVPVWTGSLLMVDQPPTLSYPFALTPTGDALYNPAVGEGWRDFIAPINNFAGDVWISWQEQSGVAASGAFVDLVGATGSPDIQVAKAPGGAVTVNGVAAGSSAGVGNTDFFVVHIVKFNGLTSVIHFYLNPGAVLNAPSASMSATLPIQVKEFYYRSDASQSLDEIRAGTAPGDVAAAAFQDTDQDGIPDALDNCVLAANPTQLDANADGYGNACDADLDDNGTVTATDFALLRSVLGQTSGSSALAAAADLDGNGTVTATDFAMMRKALGGPPGPSGLHPNCPPTCP